MSKYKVGTNLLDLRVTQQSDQRPLITSHFFAYSHGLAFLKIGESVHCTVVTASHIDIMPVARIDRQGAGWLIITRPIRETAASP